MPVVIHIADYLATKALKTDAQESPLTAVDEPLRIGTTMERGSLRVHRYRDVFELSDLTNAGKRGRKVRRFSVSAAFRSGVDRDAVLEHVAGFLKDLSSFESAEQAINDHLRVHPGSLDLGFGELRGVDVTPAGFKTVKVETARLSLEVGYRSFSVKDLQDPINCPTCIPGDARKTLIPVFYQWVSDNLARIESMSYREVLREMAALDVDYHDYCRN
jgi:hypothetical protein